MEKGKDTNREKNLKNALALASFDAERYLFLWDCIDKLHNEVSNNNTSKEFLLKSLFLDISVLYAEISKLFSINLKEQRGISYSDLGDVNFEKAEKIRDNIHIIRKYDTARSIIGYEKEKFEIFYCNTCNGRILLGSDYYFDYIFGTIFNSREEFINYCDELRGVLVAISDLTFTREEIATINFVNPSPLIFNRTYSTIEINEENKLSETTFFYMFNLMHNLAYPLVIFNDLMDDYTRSFTDNFVFFSKLISTKYHETVKGIEKLMENITNDELDLLKNAFDMIDLSIGNLDGEKFSCNLRNSLHLTRGYYSKYNTTSDDTAQISPVSLYLKKAECQSMDEFVKNSRIVHDEALRIVAALTYVLKPSTTVVGDRFASMD